jgi:hypothetical protein
MVDTEAFEMDEVRELSQPMSRVSLPHERGTVATLRQASTAYGAARHFARHSGASHGSVT